MKNVGMWLENKIGTNSKEKGSSDEPLEAS